MNATINLSKVVDGKTLGDHWQFYTVNVKYLETLTHAQFCEEFPNAAIEIARASEMQDKLAALLDAPSANPPEVSL